MIPQKSNQTPPRKRQVIKVRNIPMWTNSTSFVFIENVAVCKECQNAPECSIKRSAEAHAIRNETVTSILACAHFSPQEY